MTLADNLNKLNVTAEAEKSVVSLVAQNNDAYNSDGTLRTNNTWLENCEAYLDRPSSGEAFTFYAEFDGQAARWCWSECKWVKTQPN